MVVTFDSNPELSNLNKRLVNSSSFQNDYSSRKLRSRGMSLTRKEFRTSDRLMQGDGSPKKRGHTSDAFKFLMKYTDKEQEMEKEKEREMEREMEIERENRRKMDREREKMREMEKERMRDIERERENKREIERERETMREIEREMEQKRKMDREREREIERDVELMRSNERRQQEIENSMKKLRRSASLKVQPISRNFDDKDDEIWTTTRPKDQTHFPASPRNVSSTYENWLDLKEDNKKSSPWNVNDEDLMEYKRKSKYLSGAENDDAEEGSSYKGIYLTAASLLAAGVTVAIVKNKFFS